MTSNDTKGIGLPLTQESIAITLAQNPSNQDLANLLYHSIKSLILKKAHSLKYNGAFGESVEDLCQDCMSRIFSKIESFDPNKGAFSTWAGEVANNVLLRKVQRNTKRNSIFSYMLDSEDFDLDSIEEMGVVDDSFSNRVIAKAVSDLIKDFPEWKSVCLLIFGDPDSDLFSVPRSVNWAEVARMSGVCKYDLYDFKSNIMKPYLKRMLSL